MEEVNRPHRLSDRHVQRHRQDFFIPGQRALGAKDEGGRPSVGALVDDFEGHAVSGHAAGRQMKERLVAEPAVVARERAIDEGA